MSDPAGKREPAEASPVRAAKRALRQAVLARREALGEPARQAASRRIVERVLELPEFRAARGVHCFLSMPGEVDTAGIFAACAATGKVTFVPVQVPGERRLACVVWSPGEPLVFGPFGVREPAPDRQIPADVAAIDLVLAPGAAFDRSGNRLGYGIGYYDGFLKSLADRHGPAGWSASGLIARPAVIALAFAVQIVDAVPADSWDIRVPAILTEEGVLRIAPGRS